MGRRLDYVAVVVELTLASEIRLIASAGPLPLPAFLLVVPTGLSPPSPFFSLPSLSFYKIQRPGETQLSTSYPLQGLVFVLIFP